MKVSIKQTQDLELIVVKAKSFPQGIPAAWNKLEKDLTSKKGRKFFGLSKCINDGLVYFAGMHKTEADQESVSVFETYTLAGGKWACRKIRDWKNKLADIGPSFTELEKGRDLDHSRPFVEFYRSDSELQIWVPII